MNFVQKWALLAVKLKKFSDLIINAHFEAFFQIYPSMLKQITAELTIPTVVIKKTTTTKCQARNPSFWKNGMNVRKLKLLD